MLALARLAFFENLLVGQESSVCCPHWQVSLGVFPLPKTFGNSHGKVHRAKNVFHLAQAPFVMLLSPIFMMVAQISLWIAWNGRWFLVKTRKWNMLFHRKFPKGKQLGLPFFKMQLFPGTFQWNVRKTCVPSTSQLEFSEFLSKWKAPHVQRKSIPIFAHAQNFDFCLSCREIKRF